MFLQRHCCVSVLQLTLRDGQKEREATRGVDMQLQEALIQQDAQLEAHIRSYVRHGHEQIAMHSTTCAKSHRCVSDKHRPPWFFRKVGSTFI